jgi:hypothetical protein
MLDLHLSLSLIKFAIFIGKSFGFAVLFVAITAVDVTELGTSVTSDSSLFFLYQI